MGVGGKYIASLLRHLWPKANQKTPAPTFLLTNNEPATAHQCHGKDHPQYRHGFETKAAKEYRRQKMAELRAMERDLKARGLMR
jgi:hypothetical protein